MTHHRDLVCLRDRASLIKLPETERKLWEAFWAEVAALLRSAEK